jgi:hypothetical protein
MVARSLGSNEERAVGGKEASMGDAAADESRTWVDDASDAEEGMALGHKKSAGFRR